MYQILASSNPELGPPVLNVNTTLDLLAAPVNKKNIVSEISASTKISIT